MRVYSLLPDSLDADWSTDSIGLNAIQRFYHGVSKLESLVGQGNRVAIKLAFKLFAVSDGDLSERLNQMLGRLIRRNPIVFLSELQVHRRYIVRLDGLVGNLGLEFVDRPRQREDELKRRIRSLQTVRVDSLASMRDECIAVVRLK